VRIYGMDFFQRLQEAGFVTDTLPVRDLFPPEEIRRYALDPEEILPLAHKPEKP